MNTESHLHCDSMVSSWTARPLVLQYWNHWLSWWSNQFAAVPRRRFWCRSRGKIFLTWPTIPWWRHKESRSQWSKSVLLHSILMDVIKKRGRRAIGVHCREPSGPISRNLSEWTSDRIRIVFVRARLQVPASTGASVFENWRNDGIWTLSSLRIPMQKLCPSIFDLDKLSSIHSVSSCISFQAPR